MLNLNMSIISNNLSNEFKVELEENLLNEEAQSIRHLIGLCVEHKINKVFIDTKKVENVNLGGINEIIHSHYTLAKHNQNLVLVYKSDSEMNKWVNTTGLNRFVETAIVPA